MRCKFHIQMVLWALLTLAAGITLNGQDTERPLPPVLDLVTVNPANGNSILTWQPGGSPDVAGYVFYLYRDGAGEAFDTVYMPPITSYTDIKSNANLFSVSYMVAAIDSSDNISPLSNMLSTIFTTSALDTCNNGIMVEWSSYTSDIHSVDYYTVTCSIDGGIPFTAATADAAANSSFITPVITGADYCFVIEASVDGDMISRSNRSCIATDLAKPPSWVNGDYATIEGGELLLSFSYDTDTGTERFRIEESSYPTGGYTPLATVTSAGGHLDYSISPHPSQPEYYRLAAVNSCNEPLALSNPVSVIIPALDYNGSSVAITWNSYREWTGGVDHYSVFRNHNGSFTEIGQVAPPDTSWTDNPNQFIYEVTGDSVCYYIIASEGANPWFAGAESRSATVCLHSPEKIFVPTAFTPGSGDKNGLFRPVLSFTPTGYHLVIKSRSGATVFESRDWLESWDGIYRGSRMAQDVYFWFLETESPAGRRIVRNGTITIIIN